ncbi:unnamed protein product, partial [Effrenium voratum]
APYILGTSLCSCFAFLVVSCWSSSTVSVAVVCLVLIMLQFSTCDLLTEARYAAKMQLAPEAGPDLLSFVWAGINGAAFLAMLASGPMLHDWGPRLALLAAAVPAGMVLVPVLLGCLEERKVSQEELHAIRQRYFEQRETCFLCMLMLAGALAIMMTGLLQHDPVVNFAVSLFTALFILLCFSVCLTPTIARANAFAVLYTGLSASISGASFYFYTDSPDIYPAGPHFSDFFYNTVLGAVGTVVSLLGIYLYQQYLSDLTYRQLIVVTSLAMFAFSLLDVMMFARLNVRMGIPDHWLVLGLSVCEQIIWQWQWMPQVVLLAALCPAGMEATMLALLAGCHNLGNTLGSNFGAVLLHLLEVRPRGRVGDAAELENLWIAAGVSSVLPLFTAIFLRFLLPDCKQNAKITTVADPTHNSLLRRNNFAKAAKWSPDGSVAIAVHDDEILRMYQVPQAEDLEGTKTLFPYAETAEGGPVLDFCFFPSFTWEYPGTCCFITSSQDHPIHLRDAVTGELRNTYRPFNNVDEVCHASSLCFSPDGSKIIAGFSLYLRVFHLQRPGRQMEDWLLGTKKGTGQKGIIGAVAASLWQPGLYAAGSYNKSICLYQESSRGKAVARLADSKMGGVTQLAFGSEWLLLSGHRKDSWLRAWDLRMLGEQGNEALLQELPRSVNTHQRFHFGVQDDLLSTGDDSGNILLYSLSSMQEVGRFQGHSRPCTSAELRPTEAKERVLLSSSGSRHFPDYDVDSPEPERRKVARLDNSLRVWQLGFGDES